MIMKMGKSKPRRLEEMALRVMNKPTITEEPTNRAERRALKRHKRKETKR